MRIYIFLFLIAIYTLSLKSQTKGSVIDGKDNYPLSGVNIYMQRDSVGIGITDETGYFNVANIEKFAGNDTIVFSYIGYLSLKLSLKDLQYLGYRVLMYAHSQQLPEVIEKYSIGAKLSTLHSSSCNKCFIIISSSVFIINTSFYFFIIKLLYYIFKQTRKIITFTRL